MTQIINMTPHDVYILDENGQRVHTFPQSGNTIRLAVNTVRGEDIEIRGNQYGTPEEVEEQGGYLFSIPTSRTVFGEPVGLPEAKSAVYYIVSQLVKSALPDRLDLLVPAEGVRMATY